MNPRWRMLLWEQCRLIVPAFVGLYALFAVGLFGGHHLASNRLIWWGTYESLTAILLLFPSITFIGLLLVRRNNEGRITLTFDTRYFQLPVRTVELVGFLLGLRILFLLTFLTTTLITGRFVSEEMFTFKILGIMLIIFCWLQIFAWGWKAYKPYLIFLSVVLAVAFYYFAFVYPWWSFYDRDNNLGMYFTGISFFLLLFCFSAILRERTEMIATLPTFDYLTAWLEFNKLKTLPHFNSQLEA